MLFERGSPTLTMREATLNKQIDYRIQDESEQQMEALYGKKGVVTEDDMMENVANSFSRLFTRRVNKRFPARPDPLCWRSLDRLPWPCQGRPAGQRQAPWLSPMGLRLWRPERMDM